MEAPPLTPDQLVALARAMLGLELPDVAIPGVIDSLALLAGHARIVEDTSIVEDARTVESAA